MLCDEWFNQIANREFLVYCDRNVALSTVRLSHGGHSLGISIAASCGKTSGRQGDVAVGKGIAFRDSAALVLMQRHPGITVTIQARSKQRFYDSVFAVDSPNGRGQYLCDIEPLRADLCYFRPLAALVTGVVGGILADVIDRPSAGKALLATKCADECCSGSGKNGKLLRVLKYGFVTLPRDIGKPLLVGLVVASVIAAVVPDGFFAEKLGTGFLAMVVMMVVGIPMYVCATASVPIAAALILKGLTPGAALVFLMTGPATNAAGLATIWKALGARTAIAYLLTAAGCALLGGILLDSITGDVNIAGGLQADLMLPPALKYVSTLVLLAILVSGLWGARKTGNARVLR